MNIYRILENVTGNFFNAGLWSAGSRGKIWFSKGLVKSSLAGHSKSKTEDMTVIEYEVTEKKRYRVIERPVPNAYTKYYDLEEITEDDTTKEVAIDLQPTMEDTDTRIDWSKIEET